MRKSAAWFLSLIFFAFGVAGAFAAPQSAIALILAALFVQREAHNG